jgi:dynein heavy chain
MALTISQAGSGNSTASSATLAVTLTQSFAVGDMVVVCIASDNNGTNGADSVLSVTDSRSHTYTVRAEQNNDPGAAAAGASVNIYTTIVTTAMTTSDVVTTNFSPNTASKAMVIWEVAPGAGETPTYVSNGGSTNNGTNPALTSTSIASGNAVIYALAAETAATLTGDSDTTRGSWSALYSSVANTGTNGTSMTVGSQYKVVNAAGTQAWGTTLNTSDWAISYIILNPALPASTISRTATGSGTGTETATGRDATFSTTATGSGAGTETASGGRFVPKSFLHVQYSTNFYGGGAALYIGLRVGVFSRTATGSGTGTQTATRLITDLRTAIGSGTGTQTATGFKTKLRTATGSGIGTQTAARLITRPRTATGSGAGTQTATRLITDLRTATGSGTGTQTATGVKTKIRTATGSGVGTQVATGAVITGAIPRTATGSGVGTQSATGLHIRTRFATGSGVGTQSATDIVINRRTATGSGVGTINVTRTNFVTNPNLETNATGWTAASVPVVRSTDFAISGTASLKVTMSSATDNNIMVNTPNFVGTGNATFSVYAYIPVGSTLAGKSISVFPEAGSATQTAVSATNAILVAGSWVRTSVTRNITVAGTLVMVTRINVLPSTVAGENIYFDAALAEFSSSALPYFDGAGIATYSGYTLTSVGWNGTANASTSTANFIGVVQVKTAKRTATGSGVGTQTATPSRVVARTGAASAGTGSSTVSRVISNRRTATGSGIGIGVASRRVVKLRTATGSGAGTQTGTGARVRVSAATGSGVGDCIPPTWVKSHIFRLAPRNTVKFTERSSPGDGDILFRYAARRPRGDNLYRLVDGSYTITDPRRPELIVRTYLGGHDNFLSDDEVVELTTAGYGANIT